MRKKADKGKKNSTELEVGDKILYRKNHREWLTAKAVEGTGTPRPIIIKTPESNK